MATYYPNTKFTLLDRAKLAPDGKTAAYVVSVMNLGGVDDFFQDVPFQECNMGLVHHITRDTGMIESANRKLNQGVKSSKRNIQVVDEPTQLKERWRKTDEQEIDTLANREAHLRGEDEAHIRKLGEDVVKAFFNGADEVNGLFGRMNALNPTGLNNVLSNGYDTAASTTRIIIVEWSTIAKGGCYGVYPTGHNPNAKFGIFAKDWGKSVGLDENDTSKELVYYRAQFCAWTGLAVENNRKMACLANINPDIDGAKNFADGGVKKLIQLLDEGAFNRRDTRIYVNTRVKAQMDIYAESKNNVLWGKEEIFGRPVTTFQQVPIRVLDNAIVPNNQAVLV